MTAQRRRYGKSISEPINQLLDDPYTDSLRFIEHDDLAAYKTRTSISMYIGRHHLPLSTHVKDNEIYVLKNPDIIGSSIIQDLRSR